MGIQIPRDISVDFSNGRYIILNAKQYDSRSRFIRVTCTNLGQKVNLTPDDYSAFIRYRKSDGYSAFNKCIISTDGKIIFELTEQMLSTVGTSYADLVIIDIVKSDINSDTTIISADGKIIENNNSLVSTMNFYINVLERPLNDEDIVSTNEFSALNELLNKANKNYEYIVTTTKEYMDNAKESETNAKESENKAEEFANIATEKADEAQASQNAAKESETNSIYYSKLSQSYAIGESGIRENEDIDNSKYYKEQSAISETNATNSANIATEKADEAATSANIAQTAAETASDKADIATNSANIATEKADEAQASQNAAKESENKAKQSENISIEKADEAVASAEKSSKDATDANNSAISAKENADKSESFLHGGTGIRENEDKDNSQYYYEQIKNISDNSNIITSYKTEYQQSTSGINIPINEWSTTVPEVKQGMYLWTRITFNFSNGETSVSYSVSYFGIDGSGGSASNLEQIICDNNGKAILDSDKNKLSVWGQRQVIGIKGDAEKEYRNGNINITAENVGALPLHGTAEKSLSIVNSFNQRIKSADIDFSDPNFQNKVTYMLISGDVTNNKTKLDLVTLNLGWDRGNYGIQIGANINNRRVFIRGMVNGTYSSFEEFITSYNLNNMLQNHGVTAEISTSGTSLVGLPFAGCVDGIINDLYAWSKTVRSGFYTVNVANRGWLNLLLLRHRNGQGDGKDYAFYIFSSLTAEGNLGWNKMRNGTWQGERALLDSSNYANYAMPIKATAGNEFNFSSWGDNTQVWFNYRDGLTKGAPTTRIEKYIFGRANATSDANNRADIDFRGATCYQSINSSVNAGTYLNGAKGINVGLNMTNAGTGYTVLAKLNVSNGVFTIDSYQNAININYISNTRINNNTNSTDKTLNLLNINGDTVFPGKVKAQAYVANDIISSTGSSYGYIKMDDSGEKIILSNNKYGLPHRGVEYSFKTNSIYFRPTVDNSCYLGSSSQRWNQIYSANSSISTSDRREKKDISYIGFYNACDNTYMLDETLLKFINGLLPCIYLRTNGESGRPHHGFIAQDVEELMRRLGIKDHAAFIKSPKTKEVEVEEEVEREVNEEITNEDGTTEIVTKVVKEIQKRTEQKEIPGEYIYGLRYEEFIADIVRYCQILWNKTEAQEKKIQKQEEKIKQQQEEMEDLKTRLERLEAIMSQ